MPATLVFFETGPRIAAMLADLAAVLGAREAAVCRELTKLHEEVRRGDLAALAQAYDEGAETRGEFVVVVGPPAAGGTVDADDARRPAAPRAGERLAQGCGRRPWSRRPATSAGWSISARCRSRKGADDGEA